MQQQNGWVYTPYALEDVCYIHLVGCGGTGARVLTPLLKIFPRRIPCVEIHLWDGDRVEERNLLRQNFTAEDVGLNKAQVLAERFAGIDARFTFTAHTEMLEVNSFKENWGYNTKTFVLGCTDSPRFRQQMAEMFIPRCFNENLLWLDAGNERTTGQVIWNGWWWVAVKNLLTKVDTGSVRITFQGLRRFYPSLVDGSSGEFDQPCGARLDLQTAAVNQLAASWMICLLSNFLSGKQTNAVGVQFSTDGESSRLVMREPDLRELNLGYWLEL